MNSERILTISNIISVLRAAMAVPIIIFLSRDQMILATLFIMFAIVSDFIDGYFARKLNNVTLLGRTLDPLADKICILSIILFLVIKSKIPYHILVVLCVRDILIAAMLLYLINFKLMAIETNYAGKISTVLISMTVVAYIYDIKSIQASLILMTYIAIAISFAQYLFVFVNNFGKRKIYY